MICTTEPQIVRHSRPTWPGRLGGTIPIHAFTLLELLVGLSLTMLVAAALAPLWVSWQRALVGAADHTLAGLQGRVAAERFERDCRLATTLGCGDLGGASVVLATASQVVIVSRPAGAHAATELVEWEVSGGSLMRRRGSWPGLLPSAFPHALFTDNKTMLEGLSADSVFEYWAGGVKAEDPASLRSEIDVVRLSGSARGQSETGEVGSGLLAEAVIGR